MEIPNKELEKFRREHSEDFDILSKLKASVGDIPLIVEVDFEKFKKSLAQHRLSRGVFYRVKKVPNIDMANRYMEKVRSYRL